MLEVCLFCSWGDQRGIVSDWLEKNKINGLFLMDNNGTIFWMSENKQ